LDMAAEERKRAGEASAFNEIHPKISISIRNSIKISQAYSIDVGVKQQCLSQKRRRSLRSAI
jgi:hypothetical protein